MNTLPQGFRAVGLPRKEQPRPSRLGIAMFYSDRPAAAGACFTTNQVKSAHIFVDMKQLKSGHSRAILVNSGCANCCTGDRGIRDAEKTIEWASDALGVGRGDVLVASTGVIGDFMPMELLKEQIPMLSEKMLGPEGASDKSFHKAAQAIMTTDTTVKIAHASFQIGGKEVRIWGCAKGAGMIHPAMTLSGEPKGSLKGKHATMLAFILTDAASNAATLNPILELAVEQSFNRVTVDGDTSTNDTAFLLANGASGVSLSTAAAKAEFQAALDRMCIDLAKQMAKDGEGASKFLEIRVSGARSVGDAQRMAMTVATSPLVKTAAYGEDSNWGRILAAMGRSGVVFNPAKVDICFADLCVFRQGAPTSVTADEARKPLRAKEVVLDIKLHQGKAEGLYWTCDFTGQYVDINARYRT
jgi:glutamate N-acetyltransferase/amino-acid N-acetyltransferase